MRTPGWETGEGREGTEGHREGTPERDTGKGNRGYRRRRNGEGRTRRGHWETSQRTLDRGELHESATEGPARHTRSAPRARLEPHRHFADGKAPAAVGYDGNFPAGSVPDIEQVIHEGVGVTAYDKVEPAGLRHEGDVVLIAEV